MTIDLSRPPRLAAHSLDSNRASGATIVSIKLERLFGLYSYRIPSIGRQLDRTPILYGENGLGKTNILRILFHLLSTAPDRGHRTALGELKFQSVEVEFSNHIVVTAVRTPPALDGPMRLEVRKRVNQDGALLGAWDWVPPGGTANDAAHRVLTGVPPLPRRSLQGGSASKRMEQAQLILAEFLARESDPLVGEKPFLDALATNVPPVYFLNADRTLSSDRAPSEAQRVWADEGRRLRPEEMVALGRERALASAISLASRRLSQLGLRAARQASVSMHTIYKDLIKRLASRRARKSRPVGAQLEELTTRLMALSATYKEFAKYGLATEIDGASLVALLDNVRTTERSVAAEVLRPYVESLTELSRSLGGAYEVIDRFVRTVNGFLYDKSLDFNVVEGMVVKNRFREILRPDALSSGEQQLLLLFCHIALAHESGGVFIIDEPEISLNVKWQRRLVDALSSLDSGHNLQFIMASHSLEILTKHRQSVVALKETVSE